MDMCGAGDITPKVMWEPDRKQTTKLDEIRERINQKFGLKLTEYKDFHRWSCENYSEFWEEVWHFVDVIHSKSYEQVIDKSKNITEIPEWFHGSRLNYAENLLRYDDNRVALYASGEGQSEVKQMTFHELRQSVALYANAMKKMGVEKGDRVVGYIPNICETVIAMLAASSIGAVWSSTSPDFGVTGVLERFCQIQPKLIFSVNAVVYNGKVHSHLDKLQHVVEGLPDLEKVVVIPFVPEASLNITDIRNSCSLEEFLSLGGDSDPVLEFEQVPFNHPLFIMYSSGTTGAPKCMVHSVGGTLLKHLEEHVIQSNMTRDDVMFYYTTAGWMMWNWLVSSLAIGCSVVLYDGSPLIPHMNVLWQLVDTVGITILGTGAKWLQVLEEKGARPGTENSLKSLKMILSTGSPLKPQSYDFVYKEIKKDLLLASITGGTDIIACFMGQTWTLPVYRGEIQAPLLGCSMQSWDLDGKPCEGVSGDLVCTKPFPSMPVYFWNDPQGIKYKKAYFSKFTGVWSHGDYCIINPYTQGIIMLGRSDGTLNPNGVRFGSGEIYNVVESFKEIEDSVCVAQRRKDGTDERVVLFLKMAPGSEFTNAFVTNIKNSIRVSLSSRHIPAIILPIKDIPYTISGKKVEIAVRQVIMGQKVIQKGALSNPQSLDLYHNIPELKDF